ncbi:ImmA/IrrE family metallo-endopeptidase [Fodinicola acaciae]|uniref:ImmA/IrrE family metallo-endopeptidase n=1 Tax=Fodinicola acaciae TaxID=2681555 RepID=UPI0013D5B4B2|nr:ImmA/IrrE family metallo-endopeptidase [Fodinicola acaciae]
MLPETRATDLLREKFGDARQERLLETWVDFAVGTSNRSDCLGEAAIKRAATVLDVEIRSDPDLPFDGELRLIEGQSVIFLGGHVDKARQNFTMAHELGHAALYRIAPRLDQQNQPTEKLCNLFAAELLMPRAHVEEQGDGGPLVRKLLALSARSGASLTSTCLRVTECFPCTAGFASKDGTIVKEYSSMPKSIDTQAHLSGIVHRGGARFQEVPVSEAWTLEVGYLGRKYVYVIRRRTD